MKGFKKFISWLLIVCGFAIGCTIFAVFSTPKDKIYLLIGSVIFGWLPFVCGVLLLRNTNKNLRELIAEKEESALLNLAKSKNGILSIAEVSLSLGLSLDESKALLERYVIKGYIDVEVNDDAVVEFRFREFLTEDAN